MIQSEDNIQKAIDLVEQAAEQVVMIDVYDQQAIKDLTELLTKISHYTADSLPRLSQAASLSASHLESSMPQEGQDSHPDLHDLEANISTFQAVFQGKLDENQVDFRFLSDAKVKDKEMSADQETQDSQSRDSFSTVVDQEIIEAYIEQQEERLADMEELILNYEHKREVEVLTELRRHLHTAKGEAGAVGFNEIERVCHLIEDYIQYSQDEIQADILLTFKD